MQKYLSSSLNSVVSIDLDSSWAARSFHEALQQHKYNARFQQKQIQEREEKLLRLYESQQQKAFERVGRGSAGSNTSLGSTGGGKVRQMFDERRQKAGVDKSYPLEPLRNKSNNSNSSIQNRGGSVDRFKNASSTVVRSVQKTTVSQQQMKNGKPLVSKRQIVNSVYNNNNGDERYEIDQRYEDDLDNSRNRHTKDIVEMMNNHNLNGGSIEDEEMPKIGFEFEESFLSSTSGKLANLGGKLPSEKVAEEKKTRNIPLGKTFRKETKPIIKRTVRPALSPSEPTQISPSVHSQPAKSVTSPISSPVRSVSQTMQRTSAKPSAKSATPSAQPRAPSSSRPSAKQLSKSAVVRDDLMECKYCSRRFATDRLQTHEDICSKTKQKKRKAYDATKHRVEGTELEQYSRKGNKNLSSRSSQKQSSKKDWRRTHEDFINAIRSAKMAQAYVAKGGKLSDLPPPPPSSNPDYVQCPHCGRRFNASAAERHIPKCVNYQFNKPKGGQPPAKGKTSISGRNHR